MHTDAFAIDAASPRVRAFAPGRTEIAGNHTDHQGGMTISATVGCGIAVELQKRAGTEALVRSDGYEDLRLDLASLAPVPQERRTTAALVRGVCSGLSRAGVPVGGFAARIESEIAPGGGLSSSAALELAFAKGLDVLFGDGRTSPAQLARIGCDAERDYFGKPCGLQDQTAIAHGGISLIDYSEPGDARVERIEADFASYGLAVALVQTGCDHSAYTDEFSQLVGDMHDVARRFGKSRLGDVDERVLLAHADAVREELSDRTFCRALHYYNEMQLVEQRAAALRAGDFPRFLMLTNASGSSSAELLDNVRVPGDGEQRALVALAAAKRFVTALYAQGLEGACRIHGGGFGGSIQAFVPAREYEAFEAAMEQVAGRGCCQLVEISEGGADARWIR